MKEFASGKLPTVTAETLKQIYPTVVNVPEHAIIDMARSGKQDAFGWLYFRYRDYI